MQISMAFKRLIVRVFETAVLNLIKLNHRGISEIAVNSLLVIYEVLDAAETVSHSAHGLGYRIMNFHNVARALAVSSILAIRRVCNTCENTKMLSHAVLTKRSLVHHAKSSNHVFVLIAVRQTRAAYVVRVHQPAHHLYSGLVLMFVTHFQQLTE